MVASLYKDVGAMVYQPFWPIDPWLTKGGSPAAPPAGVAFQTTVPHPFAAIGEKYVEIDCNNANHRFVISQPGAAGGNSSGSVRQSGQVVWITQFTSANPTSDAIIWDNDQSGTTIGTAAYRKLVWVANTKTVAFYAGATPSLIDTSIATLPATTDVQLEVIEVTKDSAGNALPNWQIVVRYSTLVNGAQGAVTTLINNWLPTSVTSGLSSSVVLNGCFGENAAKGGGKFYVGNVRGVGIDADNPPGISRVDRLEPDGSGHTTEWANNFALVNESGTGVPSDDGGNGRDSINYNLINTNKTQFYSLTAQHTASGDDVYFITKGCRVKYSGTLDKGATDTIVCDVSDGTTDVTGASDSIALSTSYQSLRATYMDKPGGTGWGHSDLTGLQGGHKGTSSTTGAAVTHYCTVDTVLVAYQKSGETMPPVPRLSWAPPRRRNVLAGR